MSSSSSAGRLIVVGGGPAGLMAAESACGRGVPVDVYEGKGSVGRKFLIAGKGGMNLTHSEAQVDFVRRYGERADEVGQWLKAFDADALRGWAGQLGITTFIGSSGRVFPSDLKAAPLLRAWVKRLRDRGVRFHVHHRWLGWDDSGALRFSRPQTEGELRLHADAVVLALGGGSWPQLGSDGAWQSWLTGRGIDVAPLQAANCGFDIGWSEHLAGKYAGAPLKPVIAHWLDRYGQSQSRQGECVITASGIEGSLIYALSASLRETINRQGFASLWLDLAPDRNAERLSQALGQPRGKHSLSEHLRRRAGIGGVKSALLHELLPPAQRNDVAALVQTIKRLPLRLHRARPLAEAISSAGGVRLEALDRQSMLRDLPGVFCAGEMLDWEAPTGGYLLTACFASGRRAGLGAAEWLQQADSRREKPRG